MSALRSWGASFVVFVLALGQSGCSSLSLDGLFGGGDDGDDEASATDKLEAGGPEGAPPTFGGASAPTPVPVGTPTYVTSDGNTVFLVADRGDNRGAIVRVAPDGATAVLVDDVHRPTGIAVDGARVYFGAGNPDGGWTYLRSIDKQTGAGTRDAYGSGAGSSLFTALANQGSTIAWASRDEQGAVYRALADGTGMTTLARKQGAVASVAVAGPWVYWAQSTQLFRQRTGVAPDAPPELVVARGLFTSVVSDGLEVFAASDDGSVVATSAADETPVIRVLTGALVSPRALAVDPWFVYAVATGTSTVVGINRRSGRTVEVWKGQDPYAIAVTSSGLWVADRSARAMFVVPKITATR